MTGIAKVIPCCTCRYARSEMLAKGKRFPYWLVRLLYNTCGNNIIGKNLSGETLHFSSLCGAEVRLYSCASVSILR